MNSRTKTTRTSAAEAGPANAGFRRPRAPRLLGVAALCIAPLISVQSAIAETESGSPANVGTVKLVLGKAYIQSAGKPRELIRPGAIVGVSDQIETAANGHVHITFVDEAMVSVRPDSVLEIVRYDFDEAHPDQSSIKLNLTEGVARAISGQGAKAARERFRLNTPIAAIGVRGTDFVVSATSQSVRALVHEGAIVVAPYSLDCLAANFGPCAVNAVELAEESLQVVQMDGSTPLPRLVPAPDERGPLSREEVEVVNVDTSGDDKTVGTGVYLETVTSRRVTAVASNALSRPPAIDFTPSTPGTAASLAGNQLAWGRYAGGQGSRERITLALAEAAQGRNATVGSSLSDRFGAEYVLFRTENGTEHVAADLGVVSFGLDRAQAFYHSATGVVAMQVNSGKLNIDFNQSTFSTQLGLNHAVTGKVDFFAADQIGVDGYFRSHTDTQTLGGAVSIDGAEAGYFFEKQLGDGSVKGLTLWDRQ